MLHPRFFPDPNVIKLFLHNGFSWQITGQPNLMFDGKAGEYTCKYFTRLKWKGRDKRSGFFFNWLWKTVLRLQQQDPMLHNILGLYFTIFHNKLECFSLAGFVWCLWVRPGTCPRVEHLKDSWLQYAPALLTNIRLGWKGLSVINTSFLRTFIK
jgi:hypothetical protein